MIFFDLFIELFQPYNLRKKFEGLTQTDLTLIAQITCLLC
jgi:hypothetical protein